MLPILLHLFASISSVLPVFDCALEQMHSVTKEGGKAWVLEAIISLDVLYIERSGSLDSSEAHDRGV